MFKEQKPRRNNELLHFAEMNRKQRFSVSFFSFKIIPKTYARWLLVKLTAAFMNLYTYMQPEENLWF